MKPSKFTTVKDMKDYLDSLPKEMDDYRVNIHVDHIDRDVVLSVFSRHRLKVLRCLVSPAALSKSKCKLWRDITPSDHLSKLLRDIIWAVTCYHIDIQISAVTENVQLIALRISHVKCDRGWIVKIQAKCLRS